MSDPFSAAPGLQRFQKVTRTPRKIRGQAQRAAAGGRIYPSGVFEVNVGGTELFDAEAIEGNLDVESYCVVLGGDKEAGHVAAVVSRAGVEGAVPIRRHAERRTITLYLNEVFADIPSLRPLVTKHCTISRESDGADGTFLQINLNSSLETAAVRRKAKEGPIVTP